MAKAKAGGTKGTSASKTAKDKATDDGLSAAAKRWLAALSQIEKEIDALGLASFTVDDRKHSAGRLRDGEDAAMIAVLDTVDAFPGRFESLAPHDHGKDPKAVETGPARDALTRRATLVPIAAKLEAVGARVSDAVLGAGELAKDVTTPAYAIIRANAPVDAALRRSAAKPLDFYAKQSRRKTAKKPA